MGFMEIALLLYDGLAPLDAVGPYEVMRNVPGWSVHTVAKARGEVRTRFVTAAPSQVAGPAPSHRPPPEPDPGPIPDDIAALHKTFGQPLLFGQSLVRSRDRGAIDHRQRRQKEAPLR